MELLFVFVPKLPLIEKNVLILKVFDDFFGYLPDMYSEYNFLIVLI